MRAIGIDYSLNSPALSAFNAAERSHYAVAFNQKKSFKKTTVYVAVGKEGTQFRFEIHPYPVWETQQERLHKLAGVLCSSILKTDKVAFEGYAMGISGARGRIFDIAEGCQTVKSQLYREFDIDPQVLSPGTIKKFATGDGRSSKIPMLKAFVDKYGFDPCDIIGGKTLSHPSEDIVDAIWIAECLSG